MAPRTPLAASAAKWVGSMAGRPPQPRSGPVALRALRAAAGAAGVDPPDHPRRGLGMIAVATSRCWRIAQSARGWARRNDERRAPASRAGRRQILRSVELLKGSARGAAEGRTLGLTLRCDHRPWRPAAGRQAPCWASMASSTSETTRCLALGSWPMASICC